MFNLPNAFWLSLYFLLSPEEEETDEFYEFTAADYYKLLGTKKEGKLIPIILFDEEIIQFLSAFSY